MDLRHDDGVEVRSVLAQPRRVALLAYLALESVDGTVRRDTLLGIFWPESDAARARGALRNAVHFLRRSLGRDAIESRGDEELRVSPERVRCDAVEFGRLLDDGRPEEALERCRGELLEGFFISGAPEFERWVDGAREGFRRRAVGTAAALAEVAEAEGRLSLAVQHARHATTLAPYDERGYLRLARLLWKAGDRPGVLTAREALAERLAECGLEPSAEAAALLGELEDAPPPASPVPTVGPSLPPPPIRPTTGRPLPRERIVAAASGDAPEGSTGGRDEPRGPGARPDGVEQAGRRGRIRAVLLGTIGLTLLVTGAGVFHAARSPEPDVSSDLIAVFPFSYRGGEELAFMDEGLVELFSLSLDGAGELRSVDPHALLRFVDRRGERPRDAAAGRALSRAMGAGWFVLGDAVEIDGRLRLTATLYEAGSGSPTQVRGVRREADAVVEGTADEAFALADRLAARLLERWRLPKGSGLRARATDSVEALKAYLRGEAHYRAARYGQALEAFRSAIEADPGFAMAHYRLSNAAIWVGQDALALREAVRARDLSAGLWREDSLLVTAWHELRAGHVPAAEALYERVTELRGDYLEAWFQFGEIRFHWGPTFGTPSSESADAFERVLDYDAYDVGALLHLLRLAAQEGRVGRVDSLAERALQREPEGPWVVEVEAIRGVLSNDPVRRERALRAASLTGQRTAENVLASVAAFTQDLEAALWLSRATASGGSRDAKSKAILVRAELTAALGRLRAAVEMLSGSPDLPPARSLEFRAMLAILPFVPVADAELVALSRALSRPAEPSLPGRGDHRGLGGGAFPPLGWEGIFEPRRLYLLGSIATRSGEVERAQEAAAQLDRLGREGRPLGPYLARLIRARIAHLQGDPGRAARELGEPRMPPIPTYETLTEYPRAYERFLRAELAAALDRPDDALRWYATFPTPTAADLPYLGPALEARARILGERGDAKAASALDDRFLALWADADPELEPLVRAARERRDRP